MDTYSGIAKSAINAAYALTHAIRPHVATSVSIMGGPFSIIAVGVKQEFVDELVCYLQHLESLWSRFIISSDITSLNNAEGKPVTVAPETVTLVNKLIEGWQLSDGHFDPTTLPLTVANGYASSRVDSSKITQLPTSARWPGNMEAIEVDENACRITLPVGTTLDPGGLGKGLAADLAVQWALDRQVDGIMVGANGDVRVSGSPPDGTAWRIGVEHPYHRDQEIGQVSLIDGAVVTSSRVTNQWETPSGITHHIINPATGFQAKTTVLSSTVVAATAVVGEVLAKLPFMIPIPEAIEQIHALGGSACIVDDQLMMHTSFGWEQYVNR